MTATERPSDRAIAQAFAIESECRELYDERASKFILHVLGRARTLDAAPADGLQQFASDLAARQVDMEPECAAIIAKNFDKLFDAPADPVPVQALPLDSEDRARAIDAAGLPEDQRCQLHALRRCIEGARAVARKIDRDNPEDPWAALLVHEDIGTLEALLDRLAGDGFPGATPKIDSTPA